MKHFIVTSVLLLAACHTQAQQLRIHTIGDSTMADYVENTTRTRGWGEMLQEFLSPDAQVINYARGGRSSRSFCEEGLWDKVKSNLTPGDYVFIQFAHNDEKEQGKDGADGRGTAPWSTYKSFLEKYVDETKAAGGTPILITPIIRRYFTPDGTISPKGCHDLSTAPDDSTLNYVRVMKHVARQKQVALIDITTLTRQFSEELGAEATTKQIYVPTDGTHTQATGAVQYAQLTVQELKRQGILTSYIKAETPLVLNPTTLNFQTLYVGDEYTLCFDLTGLNLSPATGTLILKAPQGMTISDAPHSAPQTKLEIAYQDGKLWNQCFYLHFRPTRAENISTSLSIRYGNTQRALPVKAICKDIIHKSLVNHNLSAIPLKGLKQTAQGITLETGSWLAEIDENRNRYIEVVIPTEEKALFIRQVSFTLTGDICYRIAYARGKDFYPRTDIGECQTAQSQTKRVTFPVGTTLKAGERLHIRLFPWSTQQRETLHFKIEEWQLKGTEFE